MNYPTERGMLGELYRVLADIIKTTHFFKIIFSLTVIITAAP
jgi:hypothetical protein